MWRFVAIIKSENVGQFCTPSGSNKVTRYYLTPSLPNHLVALTGCYDQLGQLLNLYFFGFRSVAQYSCLSWWYSCLIGVYSQEVEQETPPMNLSQQLLVGCAVEKMSPPCLKWWYSSNMTQKWSTQSSTRHWRPKAEWFITEWY